MGIFGWSLPPGCGSLPGEIDMPCDVCGGWPELEEAKDEANLPCICPECSECGEVGNPDCYEEDGLCGQTMSQEQIIQRSHMEEVWARQSQEEYEYHQMCEIEENIWDDDPESSRIDARKQDIARQLRSAGVDPE